MSYEEEKSPAALSGPAAEVPALAKDVKSEDASEKSTGVAHPGGIDSQDEVNAFARRDVSWTEDEERALVWRLGTFFFKSKKKLFQSIL